MPPLSNVCNHGYIVIYYKTLNNENYFSKYFVIKFNVRTRTNNFFIMYFNLLFSIPILSINIPTKAMNIVVGIILYK